MVTRDDVARLAQTSSAVVSYVINGGPRSVAAPTRERVLAAIEELGYRPNAVARALRAASTTVLGLVVPDIANPFFAELASAIENEAFQQGYTLFLGSSMRDDDRQASYLQAFLEHQVQGLLLIGATEHSGGRIPPATEAALRAAGVPLVCLDRMPEGLDASALVVDNADGGFQATRHLLEHGHAEIGTLTGPPHLSTSRERSKGWAKALRQAGIDPKSQVSVSAEFDRHAAYESARELLRRSDRPRALFVQSDEQAIGVLHAAAAEGVRVPRDLAVVSFDGIRESRLTHPALTTVQQPVDLAGRRAVEMVVERIRGEATTQVNESLPVSLIVRESCGCSQRARPRSRGGVAS